MDFLFWLESFGPAAWVRESNSLWAFPMFLFVHTLGVSLVAGGSAIIAFALLGVWPKAPIKPLERLYPLIWFGFVINLFTGLGLFSADAATRGINPDFYAKLVLVFGGVYVMARIKRQVFQSAEIERGQIPAGAKTLAWVSLVCWFGAIVTGRLIAYVGPIAGL